MREVLASKSLDAQLGAIDLSAPPSTLDQSSDSVNLRLDEQLESDRWFVDMIDSEDLQQWTSSEASGLESQDQFVSGSNPIEGDSWAALDFILALEWPCRNHVHHPLINLNAWVPGVGELYGHAMTTTAAVFAGALYPSGSGQSSRREWVLPHAEIDKSVLCQPATCVPPLKHLAHRLVELSAKLAVNDTDITPAQAYSAVRQAVPSHRFLRPILQALKQPLGKVVHRTHFGSLLDATLFWEHFNVTLQSMQFTVPELSGRQGSDEPRVGDLRA